MHFHTLKFRIIFLTLGLWSVPGYASFIETTMGTVVVNDATAAYYNPAALVLLKNTQLIPLVTMAQFNTQFKGQTTTVATDFTQAGSSHSRSNYYSPSFYFGMPINHLITLGFAAVSNFADRNPEENSILRYVESDNSIRDYDLVPSIALRVDEHVSIGGGINFSSLSFNSHPITGFPGTNIADAESHNRVDGSGIGANIGFLFRPGPCTLIGFNYRTVTTYHESGTSIFNGMTQVVSDNYHYRVRSPARSVLSVSERLTPTFGLIGTIQRVQSSITRNVNVYGIATSIGIINASIPHHLRNIWLLTLGAHYRFEPDLILRLAGTYVESPGNGNYQITIGNSFVLGTSLGYKFNKTFTLDGSYAHMFIQNKNININGNRFLVRGNNRGLRNVVSLKLTVNV